MPDFEIICLANSRKHSGRCVAGLRTDGGGWIRPVNTVGPLIRRHYVLNNNTEALVLDILNINLRTPSPKPYQPENWIIGDLPWQLIERPATQRYLSIINRFIEKGPELFRNTTDRVPLKSILSEPIPKSLTVINPDKISWLVTTSIRGNSQIRARFNLSGTHYNLVVTDIQWEKRFNSFDEGTYSSNEIGIGKNNKILLTISLGGPYKGDCFKLVAAVIVL